MLQDVLHCLQLSPFLAATLFLLLAIALNPGGNSVGFDRKYSTDMVTSSVYTQLHAL